MTTPEGSPPGSPDSDRPVTRSHADTSGSSGSLASAFPERLVTARTELRVSDPAFAEQFADSVQHSLADFEYVASWRKAAHPEVARFSLLTSIELAHRDVVRHVFLRDSGQYVGRLDLHSWDDTIPKCELGYLADSRRVGKGHMREAALRLMDAAWGLDVRRIQATCDARNTRAIRFATALGMQREGMLASYERDHDGRLCDTVMLAIVRP